MKNCRPGLQAASSGLWVPITLESFAARLSAKNILLFLIILSFKIIDTNTEW